MAAVHEPPLRVPNVKVLQTKIQIVGANTVLSALPASQYSLGSIMAFLHSVNTSWSVTNAAVNVFAGTAPNLLARRTLSTVRS